MAEHDRIEALNVHLPQFLHFLPTGILFPPRRTNPIVLPLLLQIVHTEIEEVIMLFCERDPDLR